MQAIIMAPYILQVGMGIHAFFEGISIGLQPNYTNTYALGLVVLVHKWAEGLTLGIAFSKADINKKIASIMIII